jgi:hypothetical protein
MLGAVNRLTSTDHRSSLENAPARRTAITQPSIAISVRTIFARMAALEQR